MEQHKEFYVTTTNSMPLGAGCVRVLARSYAEARDLAFQFMPEGRWSFMYETLADVHELDREVLGTISMIEGLQR